MINRLVIRLLAPLTIIIMLTGVGSNFSFASETGLGQSARSFIQYEQCLNKGNAIGDV